MLLCKPFSNFTWKLFVTFLTTWLRINIIKLGLVCNQFGIAKGASKMLDAPILIQCPYNVALDHLIANEALVSKELIVMLLAISQTLALVMSFAEERALAPGANKVIHVKVLA